MSVSEDGEIVPILQKPTTDLEPLLEESLYRSLRDNVVRTEREAKQANTARKAARAKFASFLQSEGIENFQL